MSYPGPTLKGVVLAVAVTVAGCCGFGYVFMPTQPGISAEANTPAPKQAAQSSADPTECRIQSDFIAIIRKYAEQYADATNDLAKGAARVARASAIRQRFKHVKLLTVPWVGTVQELDSTSGGRGILVVKIARDVGMTTSLGDTFTENPVLLEPGTAVYQQAVNLKVGQIVVFTGTMPATAEDGGEETSILQKNAMTQPFWLMRFQSIRPAAEADAGPHFCDGVHD